MGAAFTVEGNALDQILAGINRLKQVSSVGFEIGWPEGTPQDILRKAWITEFTAERRGDSSYLGWAAMRHTRLQMMAGAARQEIMAGINAGLSPQQIWSNVGQMGEDALLTNISNVYSPELKKYTIRKGSCVSS